MAKVEKRTNGQDLTLVISAPSVNEETLALADYNWMLEIAGTSAKVVISHEDGVLKSTGKISANSEIIENKLYVYAKSSKVPFGKGSLTTMMTIYVPNTKFAENQQVLKTLSSTIDITLV